MQNANDRSTEHIVTMVAAATTLTRIAAMRTESDVPAAQWRTLSILSSDGPQRLGEIARKSRVTQPGMTRLIGTMTASGLVVKQHDPADSRASLIAVTDAGTAALDAWKRELGTALLPLFDDLTNDEWDSLRAASSILLTRIARTQENDQ